MEYRQLGQTDLRVSALGFGCGAVGGLMVKGDKAEMEQAVARALDGGINYFDTAAMYGDGLSETNLGQVLKNLGASEAIVGTKVQLTAPEMDDIESAINKAVDISLKRLQRDCVDLMQLHNFVGVERQPKRKWVTADDVAEAMQVFEKLQGQGKIRYWGFNGLGETEAIHQALHSKAHTIQTCVNLLNPSASQPVGANFPYQDYKQVINKAAEKNIGVIAIRILAGGALSGSASRHSNATQNVGPIASGDSFAADVAQAQGFNTLITAGHVDSLVEAALRFVLGKNGVSTTLVGLSNLEQLEQALAFAGKGPLPNEALSSLHEIWENS